MTDKSRVNLTEEQIARNMEIARKRNIIVEKFYPALCEATVSVDEAKMLTQAAASLIMEEVLQTMKERTFDEIYARLVKKLTSEGERVLEIEALFDTLKGENLFVAREIIEGMTRAIDQMTMDEMRERPLNSLKADWPKMLN